MLNNRPRLGSDASASPWRQIKHVRARCLFSRHETPTRPISPAGRAFATVASTPSSSTRLPFGSWSFYLCLDCLSSLCRLRYLRQCRVHAYALIMIRRAVPWDSGGLTSGRMLRASPVQYCRVPLFIEKLGKRVSLSLTPY